MSRLACAEEIADHFVGNREAAASRIARQRRRLVVVGERRDFVDEAPAQARPQILADRPSLPALARPTPRSDGPRARSALKSVKSRRCASSPAVSIASTATSSMKQANRDRSRAGSRARRRRPPRRRAPRPPRPPRAADGIFPAPGRAPKQQRPDSAASSAAKRMSAATGSALRPDKKARERRRLGRHEVEDELLHRIHRHGRARPADRAARGPAALAQFR